ncbi:MAG: response regulator [Desulforhopalus sp.]
MIVLKVLSHELKAENYLVTAVSRGSDAISALQDTSYDLVITDMTMEGVNGLDVVKATKNIAPQTLVIVITGYSDSKLAMEAISIGIDDFLVK